MFAPPLAISTLAIVLIVALVVVIVALVFGYLGVKARSRRQAGSYAEHVAAADSALEQARAQDRGWHRDVMVEAARRALQEERPGWEFEELHLVLVDDRPGQDEDRAHFVAIGASGDEARVILGRSGDQWSAESVR
jgi:Flp pilus assembly protein TadB